MFKDNITFADKIISVLTYLTGGFAGFLWMIFCTISKKQMNKFMLFNVLQSIFLALFIFVVNMLLGLVYNLLIMIPIAFFNRFTNAVFSLIYSPMYFGRWSVVGIILLGMYIYLMLFSLLGRFAYLPWVSNIIIYQLNRF